MPNGSKTPSSVSILTIVCCIVFTVPPKGSVYVKGLLSSITVSTSSNNFSNASTASSSLT